MLRNYGERICLSGGGYATNRLAGLYATHVMESGMDADSDITMGFRALW